MQYIFMSIDIFISELAYDNNIRLQISLCLDSALTVPGTFAHSKILNQSGIEPPTPDWFRIIIE